MGEYTKHAAPRLEMKERVVKKALQEFSEKGIKAVTMDDIAASLSMSKRTLYEIFGDKNGLLKACVLQKQEEGKVAVRAIYERSTNVLEVILGVFLYSIRNVHETNKKFFDEMRKYPEACELVQNHNRHDSEDTMNFFRQGVTQGLFRDDVNFAIVNALVKEQFALLLKSDICSQHSFLEVYESIMFTFLRGICTPQGSQKLEQFITDYRKNRN